MREDPGTEGDGVETCDNPLVRGPNCDPGPSRSRAQDVAALQADPVTRTDPSSSRRTALPSNPSNPSNPSGSSIQSALPSNPSDRLQLASTARQERRPHNHAHSMPSHTLAHPRGGAPAAQRAPGQTAQTASSWTTPFSSLVKAVRQLLGYGSARGSPAPGAAFRLMPAEGAGLQGAGRINVIMTNKVAAATSRQAAATSRGFRCLPYFLNTSMLAVLALLCFMALAFCRAPSLCTACIPARATGAPALTGGRGR